ncbi:MAG: hypothetical protein ACKO2K_14460, partial [Alphaproteobacteria bacterium]
MAPRATFAGAAAAGPGAAGAAGCPPTGVASDATRTRTSDAASNCARVGLQGFFATGEFRTVDTRRDDGR